MAKRKFRKVDYRGRAEDGKFIMLTRDVFESPAWRSLSLPARCLWLELTNRFDGSNNGQIFLSYREAAQRLNCGHSTIQRAFKELEERGFIRVTRKGGFSQKYDAENSRATEYKLVHLLKTDDSDFRAFKKWPLEAD